MARAVIQTTIDRANKDIRRLEDILSSVGGLDAKYQFLIGEVVMLRLFATLETTFEEIALKLCCNASYLNGVTPNLLVTSKSIVSARSSMISFGRGANKLRYLKWTRKDDIFKNLKFLMVLNDPFLNYIDIHSASFNEMRKVRNHVAHISNSTRVEYKSVIRRIYSTDIRMPVGAFLMSTKRHSLSNIIRYIQISKVIIHDIAKG